MREKALRTQGATDERLKDPSGRARGGERQESAHERPRIDRMKSTGIRRFLALALWLSTCGAPAVSTAQPASLCPAFHPAGRAPVLVNPALAQRTRELCFEAFGVLHSGVSRTPLWVAEHLTRAQLLDARDEVRATKFVPEPRLPKSERAELDDYRGSGWDRGHMAPAADMPTASAMADSFSLANVVPQARRNNQGVWADVERTVRREAQRRGALHVVTGPVFAGERLMRLNGRVLVPTQIWKAVLDPARGEAWAYLVDNADEARVEVVPLETVEAVAGLQLFPGQARRMPDHPPRPESRRRGDRR